MNDPMNQLVAALADVLVEDYLREIASGTNASNDGQENPACPNLPNAA
ncbi:hypothetical protein [Coralloluteibacterium thermophilus]|uniref:IS256 family transposase n=1 Tax=Coralloluteibacterium thermophilum TaxID=2707049 RepID=A0ABV9NGQ3_9GAMM